MDKNPEITEIKKQIAAYKKVFYFWIVAFFVVMIALIVFSIVYIANLGAAVSEVAESINQTGNVQISLERNNLLSADYLATVIPILITLAGSLLAFLGMNRLKMFDERIDKNRVDILAEMGEKVKSAVELTQEKQSETIIEKVKTIDGNHLERMNEIVEQCQTIKSENQQLISEFSITVTNSISKVEQEVQTSLSRFDEMANQFEKKYGWLREPITENRVDLNFTTLSGACTVVEALCKNKASNYIALIKGVVNNVISSPDINGSANDYHNLAAALAREDLYNEACSILDKGRTLFKADTDLLSDLVQYASEVSKTDAAEKAVSSLLDIDSIFWSWRCYEFLINYYTSIGDLKEAYRLSIEFIEKYPNNERGYRQKAEIELQLHRGSEGIKEAITTLKQAIENHVNCPQCANALGEIMLSQGDYDEAIKYESKAIMELAQEQPHINIAHVFFNRATAYDRIFMRNLMSGVICKETAEKGIDDYKAALTFPKLASITAEQAKQRLILLLRYNTDNTVTDPGDYGQLLDLLKKLSISSNEDRTDAEKEEMETQE